MRTGIIANNFYNIVGYSLPGCDLQYMWSISTQYNVVIKQVSLVVTLFLLRTPGVQSMWWCDF